VVVSSALETSIGLRADWPWRGPADFACANRAGLAADVTRSPVAVDGWLEVREVDPPSRGGGGGPATAEWWRQAGRGVGRRRTGLLIGLRGPSRAAAGQDVAVTVSMLAAAVIVDELCALGVQEAVVCPGSRSAPLAYALHAADAEGRLRLHVRVDERTAAFLALGLAKATGQPVAVVTTSGTAAGNLLPALMEAHHSGVPVIAVTADRPSTLVGTGANQTADPGRMFGGVPPGAARPIASESAPSPGVPRCGGWSRRRGQPLRLPARHLNVELPDPSFGERRRRRQAPCSVESSPAPLRRPSAGPSPWSSPVPAPGEGVPSQPRPGGRLRCWPSRRSTPAAALHCRHPLPAPAAAAH
jgi:hypothetical protein